MTDIIISILCFIITLILYFYNKILYTRHRNILLMPLVFTPVIIIILLISTRIPYQDYIGETHWLLWLLGPATIAFAVPVFENMNIIRRHWLSLSIGVPVAVVVAVCSSVWLSRLLDLPDNIQRSLSVRSITTPFALEAAKKVGGLPDLVALFVVVTGVVGMAVGDFLFLHLSIKNGFAQGAGFGASCHGAGTARAYQISQEEGVVSSLVMMLAGTVTVIVAPLISKLMW